MEGLRARLRFGLGLLDETGGETGDENRERQQIGCPRGDVWRVLEEEGSTTEHTKKPDAYTTFPSLCVDKVAR